MLNKRRSRSLVGFYVLLAYVLLQFAWWSYLMLELNTENTRLKSEVTLLKSESLEETQKTETELRSVLNKKRTMVIGEGSVFLALLLIGIIQIRKSFKKETQLAQQQSNFLLSVTHELKSPLSTVKLSLQTMAKHKLDAEKANKLITNSLVDLDRLESLVDNILFAAKIERDEPGFSDEEINVSEIVQMSVERFANNKKAIVILQNIKPDVYLNADAIGFTSVITNLVENAVKYSGEETTVVIDLKEDEQAVFLTVSDNGIGIADAEKKKVFEKFYRVGNENTRNTRGTGLGLYIVHRFVEIYKGGISIADNSPGGSIFKLTLSKRQFAEQN